MDEFMQKFYAEKSDHESTKRTLVDALARFDALKLEMDAERVKLEAEVTRLEGEVKNLQVGIVEAEAKSAEVVKEYTDMIVETHIDGMLGEFEPAVVDADVVKAMLDFSTIELKEDVLVGLDVQLEALLKDKPFLFAAVNAIANKARPFKGSASRSASSAGALSYGAARAIAAGHGKA